MQGLVAAQGNVRMIEAPRSDAGEASSPLGKLVRERDAWKAQGRDDVAMEYDRVIKEFGRGGDNTLMSILQSARGQPETEAGGSEPFADSTGAQLPAPKTKAERDLLPQGSRYVGPDGQIYTLK